MVSEKNFNNPEQALAFGKRVRELREARGWSQEELAFQADIDRSTVARVEAASQNIKLDTIFSIAKAFEISPKDLF